jgi:hypothetical protein
VIIFCGQRYDKFWENNGFHLFIVFVKEKKRKFAAFVT